jgi:hypothetical protein
MSSNIDITKHQLYSAASENVQLKQHVDSQNEALNSLKERNNHFQDIISKIESAISPLLLEHLDKDSNKTNSNSANILQNVVELLSGQSVEKTIAKALNKRVASQPFENPKDTSPKTIETDIEGRFPSTTKQIKSNVTARRRQQQQQQHTTTKSRNVNKIQSKNRHSNQPQSRRRVISTGTTKRVKIKKGLMDEREKAVYILTQILFHSSFKKNENIQFLIVVFCFLKTF